MPPRRRAQQNPITESEQGSVAAPQQPQNQPNPVPPQPERKIAELFLRQNPPNFTGAGSPAEAEEWIRAIERIFKFLECTDQECLLCVSFLLKGPADFWWEARQKTLTPEQLATFSWNQFKEELYAKFIPRSYRKQKEIEFMSLKQGNKSVAEYDREFCTLSRYAPYKVETDERMAEMFRSGLRPEIRVILAAQPPMSYAETLNRALDMEMELQTDKTVLGLNPNAPQGQSSAKSPQFGQKFKGKRKWDGKGFPNKRQFQRQGPSPQGMIRAPFQGQAQNFQNQSRPVTCFICGQPGHLSFNCPNRGKPVGRGGGKSTFVRSPQPLKAIVGYPQQQQFQSPPSPVNPTREASSSQAPVPSSQPQFHYQKAYALPQTQPEKNSGNLTGMGQLRGVPIYVLFDTGASHSFISSACVDTFELPVERAKVNYQVLSPLGGSAVVDYVCPNLEFELGSLKLKAESLRLLMMWDTDIILGMDWLAKNYVTIRCEQREISFQPPGKEPTCFYGIDERKKRVPIISALQAEKLMKNEENRAYLVYLNEGSEVKKTIEDVPIVREYSDVFPEKLPGLPPDRQLDFAIDLEPGSTPISKAPYRMAPKELQELKV